MSESTFDGYLSRWREAHPQRAIAWSFLRHDERIRYGALAALEDEWLKPLREVREPQVAAVKLGWWREELQRATDGQPRHPLTEVLFADASIRAVPLALWSAPVEAATAALSTAPSADYAAQRGMAMPLARAIAALDTRVWFGGDAGAGRAVEATLLGSLVSGVRALETESEHGRSPLPMNLLARHGLGIGDLGSDRPSRRAALHDCLDALERDLSQVATMPGPLTLFRAVSVRRDLDSVLRARRADEPLQALRQSRHGFGNALKIWRAARTWRATSRSGRHA